MQLRTCFRDRSEAGRHLAQRLEHLRGSDPLVLALPRGGVPVAYEIARVLDAPMDLLLVRKLGAPGHAEYGIGAVADGVEPQLVLNEQAIGALRVSADYIRQELVRQVAELRRRRALYCDDRPPPDVSRRTVIVVDDGVATGGTVEAALRSLKQAGAGHLVLAVPVAPAETLSHLKAWCDEIICLETPDPFVAVGLHYDDFTQVSDEQVRQCLTASASEK